MKDVLFFLFKCVFKMEVVIGIKTSLQCFGRINVCIVFGTSKVK